MIYLLLYILLFIILFEIFTQYYIIRTKYMIIIINGVEKYIYIAYQISNSFSLLTLRKPNK